MWRALTPDMHTSVAARSDQPTLSSIKRGSREQRAVMRVCKRANALPFESIPEEHAAAFIAGDRLIA